MIAAEDAHKRLLESLYFPDIRSRQEGIEQVHRQTFEWIFEKAGNQSRPWHHFVDWLEKGHGTYWISGKAGAGKSTLMNFICQDPRTEGALRVWSGINEVFIPKFFFWNPGTLLQKSLAGLLRSLIYQLLDRFPDLIPLTISSMGPTEPRLQQLPTWTEHRLRATLQHLLSYGLKAYSLCIFIDGLDEFSGDHTIPLDLIRDLRQNTRVKFCLSSRPYQSFKNEFESSAMLKLQDLTEPDIRRYVLEKLDGAALKASKIAYSAFDLEHTTDTIVDKAKGIFLWVNLAVRDQIEGIRNADDAEQLRERLDLLPEEIEELYGRMLQKIDKVYRKEVSQYLQLVLQNDRPSLFHIALAVYKRIDDIVMFTPDIAISDIRNHCRLTRNRIATTCKGFLEVQEEIDLQEWQNAVDNPCSEDDHSSRNFSESLEQQNTPLEQREDLIETKIYQLRTRIEFLHRTAVDFFEDNEQGKNFLETNAPRSSHPKTLYVKAQLAELIIFPVPTNNYDVRKSVREIVKGAYHAETETGVAQLALMDLVDRSLAMLCQRSPGQPSDLHWCRAWGFPGLFGSSPSKPENQYTGEPQHDDILIPYPVDFLGFAAWCGLHKYVEHTLDSQSGRPNPSISDYLLSCTVDGFRYEYRRSAWRPYMKLISALLKRGANPNMENLDGTVWGSFLRNLHSLSYRYLSTSREPSEISESLETSCWDTIREFLGSGANVNEKFDLILENIILGFVTHSASSKPLQLAEYRITLHISALSVLQQCFAHALEYSKIEGACIASGASPYFECSKIIFHVEKNGNHRWVCLNLSKQQMIQFSQDLDQSLRALAGDSFERHQRIEAQVVELFQELDIQRLYQQAGYEEVLQGRSIQE